MVMGGRRLSSTCVPIGNCCDIGKSLAKAAQEAAPPGIVVRACCILVADYGELLT